MPGIHSERWQVPPLELLLAFEASARHLSFTKAAAELFLTQSAISRQIQALEESVGGKLFERRTRALLLTEGGQRSLWIPGMHPLYAQRPFVSLGLSPHHGCTNNMYPGAPHGP